MAFNDLANFSPAFSLFKRCVQCPDVAPTCPACSANQVCKQYLGNCDSCASAKCVSESTSGSLQASSNSSSNGPNVGAIVGGVIGSVAFISIVVFCIWKFWFKGRRHEIELEEEWEDEEDAAEKSNASVFTREARSRASTHTVASLASTVLTRASNIIQIAYIPGVTNRSNASSDPNMLVPPVPPIPIATTPSSTTNSSHFEDQMLFMPGDLRDSTYSDMSSFTMAEGARRPGSIASSLVRNSVATTIYRDSAVVNPMPAQQLIPVKAAMVSVKGTSPGSTPPVPAVDFAKHGGNAVKPVIVKMPSSGAGSATSSLKTMKPVALNIIRKNKKDAETTSIPSSPLAGDNRKSKRSTGNSLAPSEMTIDTHRRARQSGLRASNLTMYSDSTVDDDDDHERSRRSLLERRNETTASPFTDAAAIQEDKEVKTPTETTYKDLLTGSPPKSSKPEEARGKSPFEDPE